MSSANLTREETAQRSQAVCLETIAVNLDLTQAADPAVSGFPVTTTLTFTATTPNTWIDFIGEAVNSVTVNGENHAVDWDGSRIHVTGLAEHNTVTVDSVGAYSRSGEGMHRYVDPADNNTYLYTQYEPADSRRVMACFEQPDLKARYTFTVQAPTGWSVLSNGVATDTRISSNSQTVTFAETKPISSYITCVTAGPYHRVDAVWNSPTQSVDLGVLCRASLAEHLDSHEIIEITQQGLDFFTTAFDYEYPWGKYDQIFVPEYNLGAMENPGLVTFTEAYIFRGAATRSQHENRANTILHEMAHMWFGDLVTMKWWDDLWLKESFADYMGAHALVHATTFTDAWVTFANRRKAWAYQQDQLPTTHPIVADIHDLEAAKLNFDGITYAKGAAVLKQLVAYVGQDAFFTAAQRYFRRHEYANTTLNDLLVILEEVSGKDVHAWSQAWLETTGMSTLAAHEDNGHVTLTQDVARPHRLNIGLYGWEKETTQDDLTPLSVHDVTIDKETNTITVPGWEDAALRVINEDDWTYAKVRLDDTSLHAVKQGLSGVSSALTRALLWSALWNAVRDAQLPTSEYVSIVAQHAPHENNSALLSGVLANTFYAIEHYAAPDSRNTLRSLWAHTTWDALAAATPASDSQLAWARSLGEITSVADTHAHAVAEILSGSRPAPEGLALDPDLRWQWLTALCTLGQAGRVEADDQLSRDNTGDGRTAHLRALASQPTSEQRAANWQTAWEDTSLSNDHLSAVIDGFNAGSRTDLTESYAPEYFTRIREAWNARSIEIARRLVVGLYPSHASDSLVADWLQDNQDAPASLRRLIVEQRDHARRAAQARAGDDSTK
ncbi:aminopeptidase N [Timonella sp. A28]|uniref:aminopeptidase N n=1 Tax=Timonella sp. A28 TaxID=3442640 RepID=UPI003EBCF203